MCGLSAVCLCPVEQVMAMDKPSPRLPQNGASLAALVLSKWFLVETFMWPRQWWCVCVGGGDPGAGDSEQGHTGPNHSRWTASHPQIPHTRCSRNPQQPHTPRTCLQTRLETCEGRAVAFPPQGRQVDHTVSWTPPRASG